ncbi:hypothetical protein niasHS_000976 [Heterodera schachtii]|uniref:Ubiquitin-like domain-containing protein n=1 Tax=Heterodera schachtii TaxID=97005 RepID=A0ABD2K7V4_HETSC
MGETIGALKVRLAFDLQIPVNEIRLIFAGQILPNQLVIIGGGDPQIHHGAILRLVRVQPPAGAPQHN